MNPKLNAPDNLGLADRARSFVRRKDGALTAELTLAPGKFGLGKVPARLAPDEVTNVVCGFCSTGCGLNVHLKNKQAVNITPNPDYPVNIGMACPKGWEALEPLRASDRGVSPLVKNDAGALVPTDWDTALQRLALKFKAIQDKHGPDSVAFISTGQIVTEEMALLGALAKFGMGMVHGDGNTRQCMATAVAAYKESFGFDAPPYTYADFEESDAIFLIGSNLCIAHPILWQRIMRNKRNPRIVVIDPRKTETAIPATHHYAPAPKSDLTLLYGIAHILLKNGWVNHDYISAHTVGFAEFAKSLESFPPAVVSAATGLPEASLAEIAKIIHEGKSVSFWWTMGVNQSHEGTRTAQAIINLALMTGNIGRPGTGANSITGQCNAMGSRLFSNTTNLLGGRDFRNEGHRRDVAGILGIRPELVPDRPSWSYDGIIEGIRQDKIKGLWIIATNTAHSWINQTQARETLGKLDYLVVQDLYATTETARMADLYLPAAGWGEKEGTFINSERRHGLVKKVSRPPGLALTDFNIFKLVAQYWGCGDLFREWTSPESVFHILKRLSKGTPCDIGGIEDYAHLEAEGGIQWPLPEGSDLESTERRMFEDGRYFHPDGKARFIFEAPRTMAEPPCDEFPFILLTGRGTSAQWHTQTRTGKSEILRALYPASIYVEINPEDARDLKIQPGEQVLVASRRAKVSAQVCITPIVRRGQIFMPMHYADTNRLTYPEFDPYSRQPSYKASAVSIARLGLAQRAQPRQAEKSLVAA